MNSLYISVACGLFSILLVCERCEGDERFSNLIPTNPYVTNMIRLLHSTAVKEIEAPVNDGRDSPLIQSMNKSESNQSLELTRKSEFLAPSAKVLAPSNTTSPKTDSTSPHTDHHHANPQLNTTTANPTDPKPETTPAKNTTQEKRENCARFTNITECVRSSECFWCEVDAKIKHMRHGLIWHHGCQNFVLNGMRMWHLQDQCPLKEAYYLISFLDVASSSAILFCGAIFLLIILPIMVCCIADKVKQKRLFSKTNSHKRLKEIEPLGPKPSEPKKKEKFSPYEDDNAEQPVANYNYSY